jgi:protein phosphatase
LSGVVSVQTLQETMVELADPATTCEALVQLALRAGAPDNVTCIVADVIENAASGDLAPFVVGAASLHQPRRVLPGERGSAAERAAALTAARDDEEDPPASTPPRRARHRAIGGAALAVVLVLGGGVGAWRWVSDQVFVSDAGGSVAIFAGLPQDLGPLRLSSVQQVAADVRLAELPDYAREKITKGIPADGRARAEQIVAEYRTLAERCRALIATSAARSASASVSASPSPSPAPSPAPSRAPTPSPTATVSPARIGGTGGASRPPSPTVTAAATGATPTESAVPEPTPSATPDAASPGELDCGDLAPGGG